MSDGMFYAIFLCTIFGLFVAIGFAIVGNRDQFGAWKKDE